MRSWLQASPYRWVGFYLPAPCYTGTTWRGKRPELTAMGWGLAVVFVGEQDWPERRGEAAEVEVADSTAIRCTRSNLTPEQGREDAAEAAGEAADEGFPRGTWIYLDVERVEEVSPALEAYVRSWAHGLAADGRYRPGLYAHASNAPALLAAMQDAGSGEDPDPTRLWVARPEGFTLRRGPTESGFPGAVIWQGRLDVTETWGGVTLRIDANVAETGRPSS